MTSAIHSHGTSRRPLRAVAAAAALAGALTLTACSSDDSGSDAASSAPASPTATATATTGGSSGSTAAASSELAGSWQTTVDGKAVVLIVNGKQAALFATGGTVCSGTAGEEAGMKMIHLVCTSGAKDRTTGMVDSVSGDSMKVTWTGETGEETYTKAADGQLPSGLPTAGLG
ncbi:hypothetical protein ACWD25_16275 [Streptomyces sp. NPDC002920]